MSLKAPPIPQAAMTIKVPDPIPPQQQPGSKPGKKAAPNPTIIGTPSTQSLSLMGPGSLGLGTGSKLLG